MDVAVLKICFPLKDSEYVRVILSVLKEGREKANIYLRNFEPLFVVLVTLIVTSIASWVWRKLHDSPEYVTHRIVKYFFSHLRTFPIIRTMIQKELLKAKTTVECGVAELDSQSLVKMNRLPDKGMSKSDVLARCEEYGRLAKTKWTEGYCSGAVYVDNTELTNLMCEVYRMFTWTNPLHAGIFPDVRRMEAEVVRMCCSMFNGNEDTCGTMTSGGTESIVLACRAYREIAYERGIKYPEMLVPITAHAAFDKAAQYFRMRLTHIPLREDGSYQVDVKKMRRAINKNVCMLVGSAPQFPHGIVDQIDEIAKLGEEFNIPVHVDSCLGGFLLPFLEKAGYPLPHLFDFRLPGVTSISCDTHKYGYAPKGSSVIMYRSHDIRRYQFFIQPNWMGGIYATPTIAGSRPGALNAVCWASLLFFGEEGYVNACRDIVRVTRFIAKSAAAIPGLKVLGDPLVNVVALGSDEFNVYYLSHRLLDLGWHLSPLQFPPSIHLCVTHIHTKEGVAERFIRDLKSEIDILRKDPDQHKECSMAIYGTSQSIPDRSLVAELANCYISSCYNTEFPLYKQKLLEREAKMETERANRH